MRASSANVSYHDESPSYQKVAVYSLVIMEFYTGYLLKFIQVGAKLYTLIQATIIFNMIWGSNLASFVLLQVMPT